VGSLAKIHTAKNMLSHKEYSVKKVIRRELHPGDFAALSDEIAVLQEVAQGGKTRVVCLYEVYEDPDATYLVLERIHGDILIDRLIQKKKYTEFDAKELVRNLLQGVHHCHEKSIAIRNLTLDNLLLVGPAKS
jgi:serine/threonine protein kinase